MQRFTQASIGRSLRKKLVAQCRARLPYESCGVLYGSKAGGFVRAEGFALVRNASPDPERSFRFDPGEWVRLYYDAQKNQRAIVGFFHSHPQGPSHPSRLDGEDWEGSGTLWIVDLSDGVGKLYVYAADSAAVRNSFWQTLPLSVDNDGPASDGFGCSC